MVLLKRPIFYILLMISCLVIAGFLIWKDFLDSPLKVQKPSIFYLAPGSSIYSVAKSLKKDNIISSSNLFILLAELRGDTKHLKAGEYLIAPGMTPDALLKHIIHGKVFLRHYTIVEGWTLRQVLATINANPYLAHKGGLLSSIQVAKTLGIKDGNLEGYLYPDTYLFAAGIHDSVILKKAYKYMQHTLEKLWLARAKDLPYQNLYQVLIVASLIEKETARPEERAKIAGVILRRLKINMRLQIDASVIYGLGDSYTGKLTRADLARNHLIIRTCISAYLQRQLQCQAWLQLWQLFIPHRVKSYTMWRVGMVLTNFLTAFRSMIKLLRISMYNTLMKSKIILALTFPLG